MIDSSTRGEPKQTGIKVYPDVSQRLDILAAATGRTKSDIADEAFLRFLDTEEARLARRPTRRRRRELSHP